MSVIATLAPALNAARLTLASELEILPDAERVATMYAACIETGGRFEPRSIEPDDDNFCEITCLGVSYSGDSAAEAVAHWVKAVYRMAGDADFAEAVA